MPESLCLGNGILELVSRTRPLATPREVFTEEEEEGSLPFRAAFVSSRIINVPLGRLLLLSREEQGTQEDGKGMECQ